MAKTYTTIQGDMWDAIAHRQLGSTAYTGSLMRLNPQFREYYIFPAGIVLRLPDTAELTKQAAADIDGLPPWKR